MLDEEIRKVKFLEKFGKNSKGSKGVSFVPCHPSLNCLSRIIKDNLNISFMSREAKAVFSPGHMVLFRSARRTSSYEVFTNVTKTDTFSSTATDETFEINHELNCDDKCLIYLLKCKVCNKQYVGETTDQFRLRWNNFKDKDKNFRDMKVVCNNIFMNIFIAKFITDSWGMFLLV